MALAAWKPPDGGRDRLVLAPKSVAEAAELKAPVKPQLNVVDIGDLYSYGYATSFRIGVRTSVQPTLQALNQYRQ